MSLINVFADDPNPLKDNNSLNNSTNISEKSDVQPLAIIIWSFSVSPTSVNLGNLPADNSERSFPGRTNISVSALGSTDLYVRASGDFISTSNSSNTIALSNFQYDGFKNTGLTKRPFTTNDVLVKTWTGFFVSDTVPVNYYLRVPIGTEPGTYTVTIYYTAV